MVAARVVALKDGNWLTVAVVVLLGNVQIGIGWKQNMDAHTDETAIVNDRIPIGIVVVIAAAANCLCNTIGRAAAVSLPI